MMHSPSKFHSLRFLKSLKENNYISLSNKEYCDYEIDEMYNEKQCLLAQKLTDSAPCLEEKYYLQKYGPMVTITNENNVKNSTREEKMKVKNYNFKSLKYYDKFCKGKMSFAKEIKGQRLKKLSKEMSKTYNLNFNFLCE